LLIDVDESYSHCPRALKFSKLWDTEQIAKHIVAEGAGDLASLWQVCRRVSLPRGGENSHSVIPLKTVSRWEFAGMDAGSPG
jgi:hypothetical protein